MLSKMKVVVSAGLAAGLLALTGASGASASSVVVTGGGSFTANAGASRLVVGGVPVDCTTTTGVANVATGTTTGTFPITIGTVIPRFSTCVGPGGLPFTVACNEAATLPPNPGSLTPASLEVTGVTVAGTTPGRLSGISCVIRFSATCYANVTGSVLVSYTNPAQAPPRGRLTVLAAGQALTVVSTCPGTIPSGAGQFGAPVTGNPVGVQNLNYIPVTTGPTIVAS